MYQSFKQDKNGKYRVLVTGASGFIATHVVQQLQQKGYRVRGTVRSKSNEQKVKPLLNLYPDAQHPLELVEADLTSSNGWTEAVKDCAFVLHMASPFHFDDLEHEDELIKPAVEGTLHVLRACREAKCVKRVVLTSSTAAVSNGLDQGGSFTENDWTNTADCKSTYVKSKTLAEKAAWDYIKDLPADERFELSVLNPSAVIGPVLCGSVSTSMGLVKALLDNAMPMVPRMHVNAVDVRDVAEAHLAAMTVHEAAGQRHLLSAGNAWWFAEIGKIISDEFKEQGYEIPAKEAPYPPNPLTTILDNSCMKTVLGVSPRPIKDSVIDMAHSMIANGMVKKTDKYKGPTSTNVR